MPKGAVLSEDDIVCYIASTDYLGVPFLVYPQVKRFHHAVPQTNSLTFARYESVHPTPDDKLASFLQTWLFFGLLQEVFGSIYQHEDFVRSYESKDGPIQVLMTTNLPSLLRKRFLATYTISDDHTSLIAHLRECIEVANEAIAVVSSRLSRKVSFSILAMTETLCYMFNAYLAKDFKFPLTWMTSLSKNYWIGQMSLNGWCTREAVITSECFISAQSLHYLSKMKKSYKDDRHHGCTKEECRGMQIDLPKYEPRHYDRCCDCAIISIDNERLNSILETEKFPLVNLEIQECTDELKIGLAESVGDMCYVALSHVWADGLGNPFGNSLAKCQLLHLQTLVQDVLRISGTDGLAMLWLDTLCVPSEPGDGKTIAMGLIRKTYQDTHHVLVLESSLRCWDTNSSDLLEAAIRIFTSPWLRRLWCLQEGALGKRLWFQFKNRPVELAEIFKELRLEFQERNFLRTEIVFDIMSVYRLLRLFISESANSREAPPITFEKITRALRYQGVSLASDEALCLANLFDIGINSR